MCGIVGILSREPALLARVQAMTDAQAHRGPDGAGYLLLGNTARLAHQQAPEPVPGDFLALGHRRLAIIDRSPAGAQPMASEDGEDWISYNGEIYNYLELRETLRAEGYGFVTDSDTEVILCAYRAWGLACFSRFNGMWAIALRDGRQRRLVLARDRLGVKPLHYAYVNDGLVFASEIKAILGCGRIQARLNLEVAFDFLKWSMLNHRDESFFKDILSFPPGHYAVVDESCRVSPQAFWKLICDAPPTESGRAQATAHFAGLFQDAVRLRMRSDVPVGACLSGGLDSSAIVCQASRLGSGEAGPIQVFNAASDDPRFDERQWCQIASQAAGAGVHYVFPSGEAFGRDLDDLIWYQEEPFASASVYAQWAVMREAGAKGVPVLLDGQGADEGLCGYRKFYWFYLHDLACKGHFGRLFAEFVALLKNGDRGLLRWREGLRYLPAFLRHRMPSMAEYLTPQGHKSWNASVLGLGIGGAFVNQRQVEDLTRYSLPVLLRYEDRNSMAWSVESRVPFLDYRLIEWLVCLPVEIKLAGGRTKALMRDALRGLVPDAILDRRDKMGFVTAQEQWMRGAQGGEIEACFAAEDFPLRALVSQSALVRAFADWRRGMPSLAQQDFFRLFILSRWMKRFDVVMD
jgi:asparagine synthase (glutamine-hydrolysing)